MSSIKKLTGLENDETFCSQALPHFGAALGEIKN